MMINPITLIAVCLIAVGFPVATWSVAEPAGPNQVISASAGIIQTDEVGSRSDRDERTPTGKELLATLSTEEREWYRRFQEGVMFFDGWNEISSTILQTLPREMAARSEPLVRRLGVKIGTQWCRSNEVRIIDTPMLKAWGKRLRSAVARGPEYTKEALHEIEAEVDRLLRNSQKLSFLLQKY